MEPAITVTTVAERPTAVIAATTTWQEFPDLWRDLLDRVYACLREQGAPRQGCNVMLYKDQVPHVEVGVELITPCPLGGPVTRSVLPAGRVVTMVHRGPYEALGTAHDAITRWCAAQGLPLAGPRWEMYGDWHDDPAQLETDVYCLLR